LWSTTHRFSTPGPQGHPQGRERDGPDALPVLPPRRLPVIDSRATDDGSAIRRRRQCPECGRRFTTIETASLTVVKRSGVTEPFSRAKVLAGVRKACQGRPVSEDDLALLAHRVEEAVRASGAAEIDAHDVGLAILARCASSTRSPTCVRLGVPRLRVAGGLRARDLLLRTERQVTSP